jgi:hypothetical protein
LVCPVLLAAGFEFDVIDAHHGVLFFPLALLVIFMDYLVIATPIVSVLIVLACHHFSTFRKMVA